MDFIVVCPHCGAYIGINRNSFFDVDYYHNFGEFSANGTLYCEGCGKESVLDIQLEPVNYNVSKVVD